jgi:glucosamine--fructose-6-phosphate aminotransferase (isomerizing)
LRVKPPDLGHQGYAGRMCGIYGGYSSLGHNPGDIKTLANHARRRGRDATGLIWMDDRNYHVIRRFDSNIKFKEAFGNSNLSFFAGHSRLVTNGFVDNQPVEFENIWTLHNGIILNEQELWSQIGLNPKKSVDSEVISAFFHWQLKKKINIEEIANSLLEKIKGSVSAAVIIPSLGKLVVLSNNGSIYLGTLGEKIYFSSERFPLQKIKLDRIQQILKPVVIDIPKSEVASNKELGKPGLNLIPALSTSLSKQDLISFKSFEFKRCSKCILPETMPFITFDSNGICNFCAHYISKNSPKSTLLLQDIVDRYKVKGENDCIFPLSGGRDSSFGLIFAVKELGLRPITYTYDWGMITDLARRNISLMCSELKVENILVAANLDKKRSNIRRNLQAWLKKPNLGMINLLTAGDKHFFRYIENVKRETGIDFNLWSVNPLEVTHFKTGFLGVPPDFETARVYQSGLTKQLSYQKIRFKEMLRNPGYLNSSLFDTLSGEFYRSRKKDENYHHLFDYYKWDEREIEETLENYGWERAKDTTSTWRIGDGTAAFYNYIMYRVAGFTEHDTFRSNQIREGQMTREEALKLVRLENEPRYPNIKWYLDVLNLDFDEVITKINQIPRLSPS